MLADRYDLALSTTSPAARDAYVRGHDLLLMPLPGAADAFATAVAEDSGFALAHLGVAQAAMMQGDMAGTQASLAAAQATGAGLSEREASHLTFFALLLTGQSAAALDAARVHLDAWPRDAAVMNYYGSVVGLLGASGRPGNKRMQEKVMDTFAPHYGDDWWFAGHRAMAIAEVGRTAEARDLAEYALSIEPRYGWAAHSRAHIAYEDNEPDGARPFLAAFLDATPREGVVWSHLAWHLAIAELHAGNHDEARRRFEAAVAPEVHTGLARTKAYDTVQFLWRWELAGHPRDRERWQTLDAFAHAWLPRAGLSFPDMHVTLADTIAGDDAAFEARLAQMDELERTGRYPEGGIVQTISRGLSCYVRGDRAAAIAQLTPLLPELERLGASSNAQLDLVTFTVLRACVELGRHDEARHVLAARRKGPGPVPVAGLH
jgi:tetratricopeptide (TPR) repeat protein